MLSKVTHNAVPSCPQARTGNNSTELPRALVFLYGPKALLKEG